MRLDPATNLRCLCRSLRRGRHDVESHRSLRLNEGRAPFSRAGRRCLSSRRLAERKLGGVVEFDRSVLPWGAAGHPLQVTTEHQNRVRVSPIGPLLSQHPRRLKEVVTVASRTTQSCRSLIETPSARYPCIQIQMPNQRLMSSQKNCTSTSPFKMRRQGESFTSCCTPQ